MRRALPLPSIGLSLLLHFAMAAVLVWHVVTHAPGAPRAMQVRSVSSAELNRELARALEANDPKAARQIAQTDDRLATALAPDKDSAEKVFLSKTNQRADRNVRAARVGKFKNVLREGAQSASTPSVAKLFELSVNPLDREQIESRTRKTGRVHAARKDRATDKVAKQAGDKAKQKMEMEPSAGRAPASAGEGFSATDDYLKDVAVGANTVLNAQQFRFYGFYERIRQRLSQEWTAQLDHQLDAYLRGGQVVEGDRRTQVEVQLDSRGELRGVRVVGSSGIEALDRAATEAFRLAAPFPNPPRGMMDDSQDVLIRWDFIVMADAQSGIRFELRRGM